MQFEQLTGGNYYHIYNRGNNRSNLFSIPVDYEHFLGLHDKYISPVADTLAWILMPNHIHILVRIKENVVYKYSLTTPIANKLVDAVGWEKWFAEHKWETTDLSAYAVPDNVGKDDNVGNGKLNADRVCPDTLGSVTQSGFGETDLSAYAVPDNVELKELNANRACPDTSGSVDAVGLNRISADGNIKKPVPYRHFSHLFNAYTRYYHNRTGGCGNLFERPFKRKRITSEEYLKRVILYIHNNPIHHGFCTHPLEYSWSSYLSCVSEKPTKLKREAVINWFGNNQNFKSEHKKPVDIEFMDKWLDVGIDYVTDVKNLTDSDLSAYEEPDNVTNKNADNVERINAPDNVELNNK